jgi:N-acetylneuraminate synthase
MANSIRIAGRTIGADHPPLVIPDIGINHEGDMDKARKMVRDAHTAGAECVKFQSHVVEDEMIPEAKKVIPGNAEESIYEIMERCALNEEEERELKELVESLDLIYLNTPFSRAAADRLKRMDVQAYKIGSGECNNYPLIEHIASFGKPIILSTGMNDIESVRPSVEIIRKSGNDLALMHCTSMYPTPYDKIRLGAIADLREAFPDVVLGLSDHSVSNFPCLGAAALGASILERHFTSDMSWPGPDVPISMDPTALKELIEGSRAIHAAIGGGKNILPEEQPTIDFAYACVVSIKEIGKGETFGENNIWVKRPGTGEIKAVDFKRLFGRKAKTDIPKDVHVTWEMIEDD